MQAYLVQHAEALSKEQNPDRPLTEAGRADIDRVGQHLAIVVGLQVARIWHSGKTRAAQTAEALASQLHPPLGVRSAEGLSPNDDPRIWGEQLSAMAHDVLLVGHLPQLARLAGLLLTGNPDQQPVSFRNGGVVCLSKEQDGWTVAWALTPQLLTG